MKRSKGLLTYDVKQEKDKLKYSLRLGIPTAYPAMTILTDVFLTSDSLLLWLFNTQYYSLVFLNS